ncbi:MAG: acetyl-CoA carboxylase biotin carboxyl carrier protein [Bacillota bacterium]
MHLSDLKELILTIDKTTIQCVEIETNDSKIRIVKPLHREEQSNDRIHRETETKEHPENIDADRLETKEKIYVIKSPIVGVYYQSSSPSAEPFVKIGDNIEKGQTLCIIEAMKTMNAIESEVSGKIIEIMVDNEETVEYGQPLMKIRR